MIPFGIHNNIPETDYHADPAYSYSSVKQAARSLKNYYWKKHKYTSPTSKFMNIGTLIGRMVLEPERYSLEGFAIKPEPRAPNGWKDEQESKGFMVLSKDDVQTAKDCAEALRTDKTARGYLLSPGLSEVTMVHEAEIVVEERVVPVRIKARIDRLPLGTDYLVDLKKVQNCEPGRWIDGENGAFWKQSKFASTISEHHYHMQAGLYTWLFSQLEPNEKRPNWVNVCVEEPEPHHVKCFQMEPESMQKGLNQFFDLLKQILICERTGEWPGYSGETETIGLERWAK